MSRLLFTIGENHEPSILPQNSGRAFPVAGLQAFALRNRPLPINRIWSRPERTASVNSTHADLARSSSRSHPDETNGGLFIIEHINLVKGGPPLHLHVHQEEWFYVIEGEVLIQIGDKPRNCRREIPFSARAEFPTPSRRLGESRAACSSPSRRLARWSSSSATQRSPIHPIRMRLSFANMKWSSSALHRSRSSSAHNQFTPAPTRHHLPRRLSAATGSPVG